MENSELPSQEVHLKYGKMLDIPEDICKIIDKYIDNPKHHDFWDEYFIKDETDRDRYNTVIINYCLMV